jgi:hypothetical protein
VVHNKNPAKDVEGTLVLDSGLRPGWYINLRDGARNSLADGRLPISLPPKETAVYVTPRPGIAGAAADWFALQRGWWQGTASTGTPVPSPEMKRTVDLTDDWAFKPLDGSLSDVKEFVDPAVDESGWTRMPLGIFTLPDHPDIRRGVLRKHFRVPEEWNAGRTLLRFSDFRDRGVIYVDGRVIDRDDPLDLVAGSDHVIAVDVQGKGMLLGTQGGAWMIYHPSPVAKQDIGGDWEASPDGLNWTGTAKLPGVMQPGMLVLRKTVQVDAAAAGKAVVLHAMEKGQQLRGAIVNGTYVRPWVRESPELNLNVTPWIKPGQANEIILQVGGASETVAEVALEFHAPGSYP